TAGRPVVAPVNIPINLSFCVLELRAGANTHLRTLRHSVNGEIASKLAIKSKTMKAEFGVNDWFFQRSGTGRGEVHAALNGHPAGLQNRYPRQVEIVAGRIQVKRMRREIVRSAASNTGILLD